MELIKKFRLFLLPASSGLFLTLSFPRFDFAILSWFALAPLLFAIQEQEPPRAFAQGFAAGLVFYFFGLAWVVNTMVNYGQMPLWLSVLVLGLLACYLAFYTGLFAFLLQYCARGRPLYFFMLAPLVWTSLEYIRSTPEELGFSWLGLGYTQYRCRAVAQMASVTGVYGISALIVLVNAGAHYALNHWLRRGAPGAEGYSQARAVGALTLAALAACMGFGFWSLDGLEREGKGAKLKVALIQGNIEQAMKWDERYRQQVMDTYARLTRQAAQAAPDLIVWPEAATPYYFGISAEETRLLREQTAAAGKPLLFGSPYYEERANGVTMYNSAYLLQPGGQTQGRYDKMHLVPFGEFVPFHGLLFFVDKMVTGIGDFGRGREPARFAVNGVPLGVSICYEITFPGLVRQPVAQGARFLVNITNDAWFGRSAASYQHLAMAALRAVENRTPVARAANTGISAVIDADGSIRQATELFTETAVTAELAPRSGGATYYTRHGDTFSQACALLALLFAAAARFTRRPA